MDTASLGQRIESTGKRLAALKRRVGQEEDRGRDREFLQDVSAVLEELRQEHQELSTAGESRESGEETQLADSFLQGVVDRKQAEEMLRNNERRLQHAEELLEAVTKGTNVIIAAQDAHLRYTFYNKAYAEEIKRLTGKDIQVGMSMAEVFADLPEQQRIALEEWSQALRGESTNKTLEFGDPGRHRRVYNILHTPVWDAQGNVVGAGEVAYDITEQAQVLSALHESEARFRSVLDNSQDVIYRLNVQTGRYDYISPSAAAVVGFTPDELMAMDAETALAMGHPDDLPALRATLARLENTDKGELEYRQRTKEGDYVWISDHMSLARDSAGRPLYRDGVIRNTNALRLAEQALRESEERYRIVFETASEGIWVTDGERKTILVNQRMADMLGYTTGELQGRIPAEFLDVDQEPIARQARQLLTAGASTHYEFKFRRKDGSTLWVTSNASPVLDSEGRLTQTVSMLADITLRKQAEEELRRALAKAEEGDRLLAALLEHLPMGITIADAPDVTTRAVSRFEREMTGRSREQLEGIPVDQRAESWDIYRADGVTRATNDELPLTRATRKGEVIRDEVWVLGRADGTRIPTLCTAAPIRDAQGRITGGVIGWQDITERRRLEEDLKKRQLELQSLFNNSNAGLVLFDATPPYTVLAHNRYYQELFAEPFRTQGMVGRNVYEYAPEVDAQGVVAVFDEVVRTMKAVDLLDFPYDSHPPEKSWFNWHLSPIIQDGELVALASMTINITNQHLAEQALRESEERFRSLYTSMTEGVALHEVVHDSRGQATDYIILDVNPAYEAITGLPKQHVVGRRASELYGIGQPPYLDVYSGVAASGQPTAFETYFAPMGKHFRISAFSPGRGRFATVFDDISEHKQAQQELERLLAENRGQREFLERLVDAAPIGIAVLRGPDHRHEMVNPYYRAIPGMPDVPMVGRTLAEVFPDLPTRGVLERIDAVYRTGQTMSIREQEASLGPGRERTYWDADQVPLHSAAGAVEGVLVLLIEVTEQVRRRRQIEELATALQSERNIFQTIMENTRTHLAYLDPQFNIVAVNATYAQGSGYSREALIGRNHFALFPHAENQAIFERVRDTGNPVEFHARPFEFPERPELGITYWDWTLVPVKRADGQTDGLVLSLMDVTQQIRAQAEIESLARFPRQNPNPVLRATRDGTILHANPGSEPLLTYWNTRVGQKMPDEWQRHIAEAIDSGVVQMVEAPCDTSTFSLSIAPVTKENYANLYGLDITERKRAEQALRQTRDYLDNLLTYANAPIIVWGPDFRITRFNTAFERLTGRKAADVQGKTLDILFPEDRREEAMAHIRRAVAGERWEVVEIPIRHVDGTVRTVLWNSATLYAADNTTAVATIAQGQDITERKQAEEALQHYADRLRTMHEADQAILAAELSVEEIAMAAIRHMPQLLDCVRVCVALYDHEAGEVSLLAVHTQGETRLAKGWCGPLYGQWEGMLDVLKQGQSYVVEDVQQGNSQSAIVEALRAEGVRAYVQVPLVVQGQLVGSLDLGMRSPGPMSQEQLEVAMEMATQVAIGIQQARLYEQVQLYAENLEKLVAERTAALQASEARFRAVFEEAAIGITLLDLEGRFMASNAAFQKMLGYSGEELHGLPFSQVTYPDDLAADRGLFQNMVAGERDSSWIEKRYVRRDGQVRWASRVASLVRDSGGTPQYVISMTEDVTEEKQALDALLWTEKLAVAGRLAASLTHEINNPLQSVMGCLALASEALVDGGDVSRYLEVARGEVRRVASTVAQLRDLQRQPTPGQKQPTDIEALVQKVLTLTRNQSATNHVEVDYSVSKGIRPILLSADQIQQVFLNLVLNALDAMPEGGRLQVHVARTRRPAGVRVTFADTGKGISEKDLPHLFEPFYSTKPGGLGLGLFISRGIIEQHEGRIDVSSHEGKGSTFGVWLPTEG